MSTTLCIVIEGNGSSKFDRAYYAESHVPMAVSKLKPHGCISGETFYPVDLSGSWLSIGVYRFASKDAAKAALDSAEIFEIMNDLPNFTDSQAVIKSFFEAF